MPSTPFTYTLVSVGVNVTPGAPPLDHAEDDAVRIVQALAGQLGPVNLRNTVLLAGQRRAVTCATLDRTLKAVAQRKPKFFAFYFGGHGTRRGLGLADGVYTFRRLHDRLDEIGATSTIVILDCCEAGGFALPLIEGLGGLPRSPEWDLQLLLAMPGLRVMMASSSTRSTYELPGVGGVFTSALIEAMQTDEPGDLGLFGAQFVSDRLAFKRAAATMAALGLSPRYFGRLGDFPLVMANVRPVGDAIVSFVEPTAGLGLNVEVVTSGRRFLSSMTVATPYDALGMPLPCEPAMILPTGGTQTFSA